MRKGTKQLSAPVVLREEQYTAADVKALRNGVGVRVVDIYQRQLRELFEITNPQVLHTPDYEKHLKTFITGKLAPTASADTLGDWVYYEWSNTLLHTLSERENYLLRTNRNKNLIYAEEQKKLANATVAIAGLSVGGNIATTLVYSGFSKRLKLADFDILETANLNRIRAKLSDIGMPKIEVIAQQVYEIDPYTEIIPFSEGLSKNNLEYFVGGDHRSDIIFEIIDDFEMKIRLREEARRQRVPVVMLTSLGDGVLIDIERYDLDGELELFNGMVDTSVLYEILAGRIDEEGKKRYAMQIVGKENVPPRAVETLREIGKTLIGRPQLMSTVTVASGIAAYITRKITLGEELPSGRYLVKFDDFITPPARK